MSRISRRWKKALSAASFLLSHRQELKKNFRFRNRHRGGRCFILCNGPSVLKQDLLPLRDEIVLSVSSGYLHKDFAQIRPAYHFVPSITYGLVTESDAVRWFQEMHDRIGAAELFLASTEFDLLNRYSLFPKRSVTYLCMARPFWPDESRIINICGLAPRIITVPIMCLIVALYMGFKDIYLLGVDHDTHVSREYKYAFEPTVLRGKDFTVTDDGKSRLSMYEELKGLTWIFKQYRHIKRIAQFNNVNIWNATAGGMLDEFRRVELAEVLLHPHS